MSEQNDNHAKNYKQLSGKEGYEKISDLVKGIHICMMTTVSTDGTLDSRPMGVQDTPFDGTLWFLTRRSSEKVGEVQRDSHVTLTFAEPKDSKYITLKGKASVVDDRNRIKELWSPMYKAWFPGGEEDPDITVLRVDVNEADYWEASSSKIVVMAQYAIAAMAGGSLPVGESGHVTV